MRVSTRAATIVRIAALTLLAISQGLSAASAAEKPWEGVWFEIWGEFTPMKVVVRDGRVVECLYKGRPQPPANLELIELSPGRLVFGRPPDFLATLTPSAAGRAAGHFHGPLGESNAMMEKQK